MKRLMWAMLSRLLDAAEFDVHTSSRPVGRRLGGHDLPNIPDKFLILTIGLSGIVSFTGYWQSA